MLRCRVQNKQVITSFYHLCISLDEFKFSLKSFLLGIKYLCCQGAMAEKPVVGGIVGPTFSCILGQQFLNLRKGDRFWYENGDHPGAFTPSQLQEIRKTSLARVICDCLDDIDLLQPFAFLQPDQFANQRTVCRGTGRSFIFSSFWSKE